MLFLLLPSFRGSFASMRFDNIIAHLNSELFLALLVLKVSDTYMDISFCG